MYLGTPYMKCRHPESRGLPLPICLCLSLFLVCRMALSHNSESIILLKQQTINGEDSSVLIESTLMAEIHAWNLK